MTCKHCDTEEDGYRGVPFKFTKNIDGSDQQFEVSIFSSPEDECAVIEIDGTFTDIRIPIKYCPMCGSTAN